MTMWTVFFGILVLIPIVGSMLYFFFAMDERRELQKRRFSSYGETTEDVWSR